MRLGARIGRAVFWGQAGRIVESSAFFGFSLLLARLLGPASYGLYAQGMGLAGLCGFLALVGLGPETLGRFLPEIVAKDGATQLSGLLKKLVAVRGVAILLLTLALVIFRSAIGRHFHFSTAGVPLLLVLLLFSIRSVLDLLTYFCSGLLEMRRVAAGKLAASLATPCAFLILWWRFAASASAAWIAVSVGAFTGICILTIPFLAYPPGVPKVMGASVRRILSFGLFAWATNFFIFMLGDSTDVLLLGWLGKGYIAIGAYAVGAKIVFSVTGMLLGWMTLSGVATLSEAWHHGGIGRLVMLAEAQWKFSVLCLAAPYFLLLRFARELITILYTSEYAASVPVIRILCGLMVCGLVCGFSVQGGILYALNHERLACALVAVAAVFNIASEIVLVRLMGINGAAWATGLSCVLLAVLCTGAAIAYVPLQIPWLFVSKILVACLFGVASTLWMHPVTLATLCAGGLLFSVAFLAGLAITKPLSGRDSASLHQINNFAGKWAHRFFADPGPAVEEGRA